MAPMGPSTKHHKLELSFYFQVAEAKFHNQYEPAKKSDKQVRILFQVACQHLTNTQCLHGISNKVVSRKGVLFQTEQLGSDPILF